MKHTARLAFGAGALLALTACVEVSAPPAGPMPPGNEPEAQARASCVRDVSAQTGNPNVSVVSSSFSEAGTEVILRVGPSGTWRCIGYRDGSTAGIMSMTNEGTL